MRTNIIGWNQAGKPNTQKQWWRIIFKVSNAHAAQLGLLTVRVAREILTMNRVHLYAV